MREGRTDPDSWPRTSAVSGRSLPTGDHRSARTGGADAPIGLRDFAEHVPLHLPLPLIARRPESCATRRTGSGTVQMIEVQLLGATEVRTAGRTYRGRDFGGAKPRQLLEVLALHAGQPVSKDRLADLLWDGEPPASFLTTLESYVSLLRRKLQPGVPARASMIRTVHGGYLLDGDQVQVDSGAVAALVARARGARAATALPLLQEALERGTGELLASEDGATWADSARQAHSRLMIDAATQGATYALQLGRPELAVELADAALARDPLAEEACRCAMRGLWTASRTAEALRRYSDLRTALADELGVDPAPATQSLMGQLLRDEAPPAVPLARRSTDLPLAEAGTPPRQVDQLAGAIVTALRGSRPGRPAQDEDPLLVAMLQGVLDHLRSETPAPVLGLPVGAAAASSLFAVA